jgi:hypothetical protein
MRVRNGIGIGIGLAVPVMILLGEGIKVDLTRNTNVVNGDGNINIAEGGGDINFAEGSVMGTTLARVPTVSFELTLPEGSPSVLATDRVLLVTDGVFDAKLVIPATLVGQVKQSIKITVNGCPEVKKRAPRFATTAKGGSGGDGR